jgi:hypothetical protein
MALFRRDKHPGEIEIPPVAASDPKGLEVARIWVVGGQQHVCLRAQAWEDPIAWGLLLVDFAKHVALAHEQCGKGTREHVLARIKEGFDAEWENPTDEPTGEILP